VTFATRVKCEDRPFTSHEAKGYYLAGRRRKRRRRRRRRRKNNDK
jgi:hypothetical protein